MFLHACVSLCALHACRSLWRPEEGAGSPCTGVIGDHQLGTELGPMSEHRVFLTAKSPFQPQLYVFFISLGKLLPFVVSESCWKSWMTVQFCGVPVMSGVHASAEISTQRLWRRRTEGPARGVILQQLSGLSETTSLYAGCRQDCSFPTAAALPAKSRSQWGSERLAESDGHTLLVAHAWFVSDLSVLPTKPIVQCLSVCFPQLFFLVGETQKILY